MAVPVAVVVRSPQREVHMGDPAQPGPPDPECAQVLSLPDRRPGSEPIRRSMEHGHGVTVTELSIEIPPDEGSVHATPSTGELISLPAVPPSPRAMSNE